MRNVEIKAKVRNLSELLAKAEELSGKPCEEIVQHDTFYNVPEGRLKLRMFEDGSSTLVYYQREDTHGPKLSSFDLADIPATSSENLNLLLRRALGEKGIVKKTRRLFLVDQTRIHVDSVEDLGDFMELEVVLKSDEHPEDGIKIAHDLMEKLGIEETDLVAGAYRDLLENENAEDE